MRIEDVSNLLEVITVFKYITFVSFFYSVLSLNIWHESVILPVCFLHKPFLDEELNYLCFLFVCLRAQSCLELFLSGFVLYS